MAPSSFSRKEKTFFVRRILGLVLNPDLLLVLRTAWVGPRGFWHPYNYNYSCVIFVALIPGPMDWP